MRITIFTVTLLMSTLALASAAETTAKQIHKAAEEFLSEFARTQSTLGYDVSHETGNLDARLSLAPCENNLEVSFSGDPWQTTQPSLLVSCQGKRPWRMFLPSTVTITGEAVVAARPLGRGERLTPGMIETRAVAINATRRGVITDPDDLIGMETRRSLNTGTVMSADLLTSPAAVARGDHVIITARKGTFSVNTRGKALTEAGVGEQVMVENLASSRTVKGLVTGPGRVEIPM